MAPITKTQAPVIQFIGVVGVAFLLVLLLFAISFGIKRFLPRKSTTEPEHGLPIAGEVAPLLPESVPIASVIDEYHQSTSYGATALQPSPADRREHVLEGEAKDEEDVEASPNKSEVEHGQASNDAASGSSREDDTPIVPSGSGHAEAEAPSDYLGGAQEDLKQPSRPYSPTTTASSAHEGQ
jgi:hypothetical protein